MFQIPDLTSLRTIEEMATAIDSCKGRLTEIQTQFGVQPLDDETRAEWAAIDESIVAITEAKKEAEGRLARVAALAAKSDHREEPRRYTPDFQIAHSRIPENL